MISSFQIIFLWNCQMNASLPPGSHSTASFVKKTFPDNFNFHCENWVENLADWFFWINKSSNFENQNIFPERTPSNATVLNISYRMITSKNWFDWMLIWNVVAPIFIVPSYAKALNFLLKFWNLIASKKLMDCFHPAKPSKFTQFRISFASIPQENPFVLFERNIPTCGVKIKLLCQNLNQPLSCII